jgi:hypothetical protein
MAKRDAVEDGRFGHFLLRHLKMLRTAAVPVLLIVVAAAASATEDDEGVSEGLKQKVDQSNAAFGETIAIDVPAFHGIEPQLALTYDSSRDNGPVGVGWRLDGLSVIERASLRNGAPRYDATDTFLLDGQTTIACPATSPSCTAGGTHATEIESYLRITRDASANNNWQVWNRDGTKLTYKALATWESYTTTDPDQVNLATNFRWLLQTVVDTHGNTVTYSYGCDTTASKADCYPDTITYGGVSIKFYRESRPDSVSYATGAGLAQMKSRLKTIDVLVGGQQLRSYKLSYGPAGATGRSRLTSVQEYGRDAAVDAAGNVSGGTSLPPITLAYQDAPNATTARPSQSPPG